MSHIVKIIIKTSKYTLKELIERGIDSKRLLFKGYGSTEMLFPRAKTEEEEEANRRVEIKIMAK